MADYIGVDHLQEIATKFSPQILTGAAHFRPDVFERMRIAVETGVQFRSVKTLLLRKGHGTVRKESGNLKPSSVGMLIERKAVCRLCAYQAKEDKDRFVEKAIFDVHDNTRFYYPATELMVSAILKNFGEDLFDCLWHGDDSLPKDGEDRNYLSLYTGFITYLNHDIAKGYINKEFGNYAEIGAIDAPVDKDDVSAFTEFVKFYRQWSPALQNAPEVLVYCTADTGLAIARAYKNYNSGNDKVLYQPNGTYKFPEWNNITVVPESSMGIGDKLIATIPQNFEYCVDSMDSRSGVLVREGSSDDLFQVIFQVQGIIGVRVNNITNSCFCMSNGSLAPRPIAGDYVKNVFVVTSNDKTLGTVTVNSAQPDNTKDYAAGTTLTLKATATEAGQFECWGDGDRNETKTVVTNGFPGAIMAIFSKKSD